MDSFSPLLFSDVLGKPAWAWWMFAAIVGALLAFDLGVLHRKQREIGVGESLRLSAAYIAIALLFGTWVWWGMGPDAGMAYMTGFFIEKSLALDNVFVISLIFTYFAIPRQYQHRVLFWGILGVIVLRGIMIAMGAALVTHVSWVLYLFGAFLLVTGVKMLVVKEGPRSLEDNPLLRVMRRRMNVSDTLHGDRFFVKLPVAGTDRVARHATPLFLALVLVEAADLVFAVDSVPAIFAITTDPYVIYTSNIFAILGLRALYFALAAMVHRFAYLKYALALVLVFIGAKIFWNQAFGKLDPAISLAITAALLAGGVIVSLLRTRGGAPVGGQDGAA